MLDCLPTRYILESSPFTLSENPGSSHFHLISKKVLINDPISQYLMATLLVHFLSGQTTDPQLLPLIPLYTTARVPFGNFKPGQFILLTSVVLSLNKTLRPYKDLILLTTSLTTFPFILSAPYCSACCSFSRSGRPPPQDLCTATSGAGMLFFLFVVLLFHYLPQFLLDFIFQKRIL